MDDVRNARCETREFHVFVIGQGLWSPWYVGATMTDLDKTYGKERVIDSPVSELALNAKSSIASLRVIHDDEDYTVIAIDDVHGRKHMFALANRQPDSTVKHTLEVAGKDLRWMGPHGYFTD